MRAYEVLDVGTVVVNHTTAMRVETLPFGGNKGSGNGREGIHDTLHEMTKEKTLLLHEVFGGAADARISRSATSAKSYDGNPAVRDISFAVAAGSVLALVRRERRRQVDADARCCPARRGPTAARSCSTASRSSSRGPPTRSRSASASSTRS